jgi:hypothetical protein
LTTDEWIKYSHTPVIKKNEVMSFAKMDGAGGHYAERGKPN